MKGYTIMLTAAHDNPDSCANTSFLEIACDVPGFDQMVSISLTALAADKDIQAWVAGCDSESESKVVALNIKKQHDLIDPK